MPRRDLLNACEAGQFGGRIAELRKRRGLSQQQLAGLAGISQGHLSVVERGRKRTSRAVARSLAEALRISLPQLLDEPGGEQNSHPPNRAG